MSIRSLSRKNAAPVLDLVQAERGVPESAGGVTPIRNVAWREHVRVQGRVRSMRITPWADVPSLECTLVDETGGLTVVFLGRRKIAGVHPGTVMQAEGTAGAHHGRLALMNPTYELVQTPHIEAPHH